MDEAASTDMPSGVAAGPCVVCGSRDRVPFDDRSTFPIVRCTGCGLRLLDPRPGAAAIAEIYGEDYFHSGASEGRGYDSYATDAENFRLTFRDRLKRLPREGRLLDVGAAAGFFVEQASLHGLAAEGVEPSEWASRYARDVLHQRVRTGILENVECEEKSYDVVTAWEVIEHLPDPRGFLERISALLKPGGLLALSTPDAGSLAARMSGRRWLGWRKVPEHLYFFDKVSLRRLLAETGFDVESEQYASLTVTWGFAFDRLATLTGIGILRRVPRRLAGRPLRVNPLYDLMILARKRRTS